MSEAVAETDLKFRVKINPDEVNRELAAAILRSGFGEKVEQSINKFLTDKKDSYSNPVDDAVKTVLKEYTLDLLKQEPFVSQIKEQLKARLTEKAVDDFVKRIVENGGRIY